MLDRLTGMRVFMAAAQAGSLSAAARQLGLSPAMASKHINALEARLGVKLLHRSTRRLSLSEAGSQYLDACQRILPEIDEVEALVVSQRIIASGLLRMNVPLSFGSRQLAPLLPEFSRRYPQVRVELGLSDAQHDLLAGNWDMAVRIGRLADSRLQGRQVGNCRMLLCAAPDYLDRRGVPRRISELTRHNCLSYTLSGMQDGRHWAFGRNGEYRIKISGDLLANNGDALLAAAVRGQGIIYQPDFIVAEAVQSGALQALELDRPLVELGGIHVLYPADRQPPAKVRVMIDYLLEVLAD